MRVNTPLECLNGKMKGGKEKVVGAERSRGAQTNEWRGGQSGEDERKRE